MTANTAGIDAHQNTITVAVIDPTGQQVAVESFDNKIDGYCQAAELLSTHSVHLVGVECSGSWGAHVAVALHTSGFDVREVPPNRGAGQRRARRLAKTDVIDSISIARAVLAEPTLGPAQALEIYDPVIAEIEAVLAHRNTLVEQRKLMLAHALDQMWQLPSELRDQIVFNGKTERRLRSLAKIDASRSTTRAGRYTLSWLIPLIDQDLSLHAEIRRLERLLGSLLDEHGTTLRDIGGIGPINAAVLLCQVGDPGRFASEAKFARWCGTGAVALSSGEGHGDPVRHRLDFRGNRTVNSVLYVASVTQQRYLPEAAVYLERKRSEGKTGREARRAHKRHLANRVIRCMWADKRAGNQGFGMAA